ncbi:phenylalanine--tRNA ligase subunit beta [Candidatus Woesearchaeota archaeon]|nr:phenylalanine--tRNA ligase subunit beta [Candidatus Woesearchaeota archaeon]
MALIVFSKKDLLKLLGKNISDEILIDRIPMLGVSLENFGEQIEIDVTPNRPDMLCVEGFARSLSTFLGIKKGLKEYCTKKSAKYKVKIDSKVKNVRPCVACAVALNVKLDSYTIQSIMQVQEKLHSTLGRNRKKVSIGVYDLNKIKFPLTYTTKPKEFCFTPLEHHMPMSLLQILQKHAKGIEYRHLLENYNEYPIWIDANKQVLSMPPIINSQETKVTETTKNLFIDITGLEQNAVEQCLKIIITALADRGAIIYDILNLNLKSDKIRIDFKYVNKLLGIELKSNEIGKLLAKMGYSLNGNIVEVPCYRTDILHQMDIAEDIAIAYGYENFVPEIERLPSEAEESKIEILKRKISEIMASLGFVETNNFNISSKEIMQNKTLSNLECIELENALNQDYNVLRSWIIPCLMQVLKDNKHNDYPQKIFEIGRVFKKGESETGVLETERMGVAICSQTANFTEIRQILDALLSSLGLDYAVEETEHASFIAGRVGRVLVNGKKIAYIGETRPEVLENFNLTMPVAAFELNVSELLKILKE